MQLYAAKEQRGDLIRELRTTHALQSPEQLEKKREKEEILSKQTHKSVIWSFPQSLSFVYSGMADLMYRHLLVHAACYLGCVLGQW